MKFATRFLLAAAPLSALLLAACASVPDVNGDKLFESAPWGTERERFVYELSDPGLDSDATCELLTIPAEGGLTRLEEHCAREEFRDDSIIEVDAATLIPLRSERTISDLKKDTRTTHTIVYGDGVASFSTSSADDDEVRQTTRDLPEPDEEHPEPGWYDDKSLFWLARGLPLAEGYTGTYVHVINVGQPRVLPVDVEVDGREQVTTAAGTFDTWKVRFERDNTVYFLWVAISEQRPVVKARIESVTYELIEMASESLRAPARGKWGRIAGFNPG